MGAGTLDAGGTARVVLRPRVLVCICRGISNTCTQFRIATLTQVLLHDQQ